MGELEAAPPNTSARMDQPGFGGRALATVATLAAVAASLGDFALLYAVNARRPGLGLPKPSAELLLTGFYLGVLALPLYGLGYWAVAGHLRAGDARGARRVFVLGAYGGALGATVHGVTAHVIRVEELAKIPASDPFAVIAQHGPFLLPLWIVLLLMTIAGSTIYATIVFEGRSAYPRWMALLNPALMIGVTSLGALQSEWLGAFLLPATPNLVHVVFFAVAALVRPHEGAS